ncbi:MAG: hypothetical protein DRR16_20405 [Candidatus Parabeggiatoa sp. nov. 3]|nr:MAG: hypothetical protein DRR00_21940 [Gammaproteobacteria bacterium]RKZ59043.1 MAG: hypothetical protein DRQ99_24455 [Gammaproteobacteria bacterium]RKZ82135.1 MAG: hypothetical protein DRR16_20405 [Gammaproteobacteria bacterium]
MTSGVQELIYEHFGQLGQLKLPEAKHDFQSPLQKNNFTTGANTQGQPLHKSINIMSCRGRPPRKPFVKLFT